MRGVDQPPDVAHLDQRADLHLAVLAAGLHDGHDVLVDPQVLGSEPSVPAGTMPGLRAAELHPLASRP